MEKMVARTSREHSETCRRPSSEQISIRFTIPWDDFGRPDSCFPHRDTSPPRRHTDVASRLCFFLSTSQLSLSSGNPLSKMLHSLPRGEVPLSKQAQAVCRSQGPNVEGSWAPMGTCCSSIRPRLKAWYTATYVDTACDIN